MRNNHKWLAALLCMVMLFNCLSIPASAAEGESPVRLYVSPAVGPDDPIAVQVVASEAQTVADGKLVVTYDAGHLTYVGAEAGAAWADSEAVTLSVNPAEGEIILAFASADAADAGTVFTLTFKASGIGSSTVALDGSSYITGAGSVSDSTIVCVSAQCVSVRLLAGAHGSFADGSAETSVTTLEGAAITADMLAPVVADRGYALIGWMTEDGTLYDLDDEITPADDMTLTAQYTFVCDGGENCPSARFVDMQNMLPMIHEAVDYMVSNGYMNGMSQTMFGPNVELNRAMMVTILYRIAGNPEVEGTPAFTDVPAGEFYTDAVVWATENGITNGISEHLFAPGKALTRQELVTFLYRFAGVMGYDRTATTDLSAYIDTNKIQPYAVEAFKWAVASGIVNGTSATTLHPENTTTRAQICIMVTRLLQAQD